MSLRVWLGTPRPTSRAAGSRWDSSSGSGSRCCHLMACAALPATLGATLAAIAPLQIPLERRDGGGGPQCVGVASTHGAGRGGGPAGRESVRWRLCVGVRPPGRVLHPEDRGRHRQVSACPGGGHPADAAGRAGERRSGIACCVPAPRRAPRAASAVPTPFRGRSTACLHHVSSPQAVRGVLLEFPTLASRDVGGSYARLVGREAGRVESLLKVSLSQPSMLLENFFALVPGGTGHDLLRVLALKGLKAQEQAEIRSEVRRVVAWRRATCRLTGCIPHSCLCPCSSRSAVGRRWRMGRRGARPSARSPSRTWGRGELACWPSAVGAQGGKAMEPHVPPLSCPQPHAALPGVHEGLGPGGACRGQDRRAGSILGDRVRQGGMEEVLYGVATGSVGLRCRACSRLGASRSPAAIIVNATSIVFAGHLISHSRAAVLDIHGSASRLCAHRVDSEV